jgi:KTSC domain-containing protein
MMSFTNTAKRSSNIARVGYDPARLELAIEFKTRGIYVYGNVSPRDHGVFMSQPSLGKAYNDMFYGKPKVYPSRKIEPTSGQ